MKWRHRRLFGALAALLAGALLTIPWAAAQAPTDPPRPPLLRGPDLTVTHFALNSSPSKTYGFLGGVASHAGYVFVPVKFTVANIGTGNARPFKIVLKTVADKGPTQQAVFLDQRGYCDKAGGVQVWFGAGGVATATDGGPVNVIAPLPASGKVEVLGATAAVWVGRAHERVLLWVVADRANDVPETDETNNESQPISVNLP
jgi:hypothetical protein